MLPLTLIPCFPQSAPMCVHVCVNLCVAVSVSFALATSPVMASLGAFCMVVFCLMSSKGVDAQTSSSCSNCPREYFDKFRRHVYVTPKSYLSFIQARRQTACCRQFPDVQLGKPQLYARGLGLLVVGRIILLTPFPPSPFSLLVPHPLKSPRFRGAVQLWVGRSCL